MTAAIAIDPVAIDTRYVNALRDQSSLRHSIRHNEQALLAVFGKNVQCRPEGSRYDVTVFVTPESPLERYSRVTEDEANQWALTIDRCFADNAADRSDDYKNGFVDRLTKNYEDLRDIDAVVCECESVYVEHRWNRYWLVTSSDGHIHKSCHCSTCNKRGRPTGFALVPSLSGSEHQAAVAKLGPALCSKCFPEAPVESREQAKVSARLALVLAEKGEKAFNEEFAKAQAKAKARDAKQCPGSGQDGSRYERWGFSQVVCPCCGYKHRSNGIRVRKHVVR